MSSHLVLDLSWHGGVLVDEGAGSDAAWMRTTSVRCISVNEMASPYWKVI